MKVRIEACGNVLRAILRRDRKKWIAAFAFFSLVSILTSLGLIRWGDTASVLILMTVCFGSLKTNVAVQRLQSAEDDEEPAQTTAEQVLSTHLKGALRVGLSTLNAESVALRLTDRSTGRVLDWKMRPSGEICVQEVSKPEPRVRSRCIDFNSAIYVQKGAAVACLGVCQRGRPISNGKLLDYLRASRHQSFETLMLSSLEVGHRWYANLEFIDAPAPSSMETELEKLRQVAGMVASALNLFQTVSDSARMEERQHLARDLHDGVTQSLIATGLQIALTERENAAALEKDNGVLNKVQDMLRCEIRKLRRQIDELQSGESSDSIQSVFERLIREFERETGIVTSFACTMKDDQVPPRLACELRYLLEEGLSNIRKHSGARSVQVRIESGERVRLQIQDDGCGFNFCGRCELAKLQSMGRRPRTICERVEANGGDLTVESSPETGVRIEISLPLPSIYPVREDEPHIVPRSRTASSRRLTKRRPLQAADHVVNRIWRVS